MERRQARNQEHLEELRRHRARTQASIAQLQVLTSALSEATEHPTLGARRRYLTEMTRVGVVDLGTNSTRLLVADVEDGAVHEVERRLTITRLGEGVDERRILLPTALARVRNTLADYRRVLEATGAERTLAVATSAVRDAENGEAFLGEIEWSYGFDTRLLSGDDEARLTFAGRDGGARAASRARWSSTSAAARRSSSSPTGT